MNVQTSKLRYVTLNEILLMLCATNRYWEANLKDKRPSESNIDMWIRAKYDQKRWAMRGPIPDPSTLGGDDDVCILLDNLI